MLDEIAVLLDEATSAGLTPARIEIGWRQAEAIAAELGRRPPVRPPSDAEIMAELMDGVPLAQGEPWTADEVYGSDGQARTLFGVPLAGVESPDFLQVVV